MEQKTGCKHIYVNNTPLHNAGDICGKGCRGDFCKDHKTDKKISQKKYREEKKVEVKNERLEELNRLYRNQNGELNLFNVEKDSIDIVNNLTHIKRQYRAILRTVDPDEFNAVFEKYIMNKLREEAQKGDEKCAYELEYNERELELDPENFIVKSPYAKWETLFCSDKEYTGSIGQGRKKMDTLKASAKPLIKKLNDMIEATKILKKIKEEEDKEREKNIKKLLEEIESIVGHDFDLDQECAEIKALYEKYGYENF